ncbi:MAG TPA: type II CAAX endopeptidase family protein [Actinomycetota bacterium]
MSTERLCASCGHPNRSIDTYCTNCAALLPPAPPDAGVDGQAPAEPAIPWRAREGLLLFPAHVLLAAVAIIPVILLAGPPPPGCLVSDGVTAAGVVITELMLLGVTLGWVKLRYRLGPRSLGLRRFTFSNVGIGVGLGIAGILAASIVSAAVLTVAEMLSGAPVEQPEQIPVCAESPSAAILVLLGIGIVLLAPIAEESFFRGFLYPGLRRWARVGTAILVSAVVFGAAHVDIGNPLAGSSFLLVPPILTLGALLAALVEWRRSIVPAILAHVTFNAFGFTIGFLIPAITAAS